MVVGGGWVDGGRWWMADGWMVVLGVSGGWW